jgi:hypothetical protein
VRFQIVKCYKAQYKRIVQLNLEEKIQEMLKFLVIISAFFQENIAHFEINLLDIIQRTAQDKILGCEIYALQVHIRGKANREEESLILNVLLALRIILGYF